MALLIILIPFICFIEYREHEIAEMQRMCDILNEEKAKDPDDWTCYELDGFL